MKLQKGDKVNLTLKLEYQGIIRGKYVFKTKLFIDEHGLLRIPESKMSKIKIAIK